MRFNENRRDIFTETDDERWIAEKIFPIASKFYIVRSWIDVENFQYWYRARKNCLKHSLSSHLKANGGNIVSWPLKISVTLSLIANDDVVKKKKKEGTYHVIFWIDFWAEASSELRFGFRLAGSLTMRHLPWTRGQFRRVRVIRDSRALKNDEAREKRSVQQKTIPQNRTCRDHGHFFRSRFLSCFVRVSACTIRLSLFPSLSFSFTVVSDRISRNP